MRESGCACIKSSPMLGIQIVAVPGSSLSIAPPRLLKGIVFDTGGLSLKISGGMCGMKADLGGAAAVLNAFEVRCQPKAMI